MKLFILFRYRPGVTYSQVACLDNDYLGQVILDRCNFSRVVDKGGMRVGPGPKWALRAQF